METIIIIFSLICLSLIAKMLYSKHQATQKEKLIESVRQEQMQLILEQNAQAELKRKKSEIAERERLQKLQEEKERKELNKQNHHPRGFKKKFHYEGIWNKQSKRIKKAA
jgi:hypothetical protein